MDLDETTLYLFSISLIILVLVLVVLLFLCCLLNRTGNRNFTEMLIASGGRRVRIKTQQRQAQRMLDRILDRILSQAQSEDQKNRNQLEEPEPA